MGDFTTLMARDGHEFQAYVGRKLSGPAEVGVGGLA